MSHAFEKPAPPPRNSGSLGENSGSRTRRRSSGGGGGGGGGGSGSDGGGSDGGGSDAESDATETTVGTLTSVDTVTDEETKMPRSFFCSMGKVLMTDPVILADGYSYERAAIEAWIKDYDTSPVTGAKLGHKDVIPNISLRQVKCYVARPHSSNLALEVAKPTLQNHS